MKKIIILLVSITFSINIYAQSFNGLGLGFSINRIDNKESFVTSLDVSYAFNNFYFEFGGMQTTKNVYKTFSKFNFGYAIHIKNDNFLIPFFGISNIDPEFNLGIYGVLNISDNFYIIGGKGIIEKFKIGVGFIINNHRWCN